MEEKINGKENSLEDSRRHKGFVAEKGPGPRHVASACDVWYLIFYFLVAKKKKKTFGGKCGAADLIVEGVSAEKIIEKIFIILRYFFFACFLVCLFIMVCFVNSKYYI